MTRQFSATEIVLKTQLITRMVWVIAFSSPDNFTISSKSLCEKTLHNLLNFVYHDYSCCRDKVNRAAGRRAVGSVFCSPFIKFTLTSKLHTYYRDSYVIRLYLDEKTTGHLPGLAKKLANPDTDGNSPYHRAVMFKRACH